jgi:hypothetical protein
MERRLDGSSDPEYPTKRTISSWRTRVASPEAGVRQLGHWDRYQVRRT